MALPVARKFNDHPFAYHAEIELEISTLTNRGHGLGRVELPAAAEAATVTGSDARLPAVSPVCAEPAGLDAPAPRQWVVMVPFCLPGERVRARVFRNHKNYSEADLVEVLRASPHRVEPRCGLFGECGGCQYQHLDYAEQLAWKRRQVEELLLHMAGIAHPVAPVIGSPRQFGYRSKITPHFKAGRPNIGFLRQGTRFEVVDVPQCHIATPEINARLGEVRGEVQARLARGEYRRDATLLLRHAAEGVTTDYEAVITEEIAPAADGDEAAAPLKLRFLARDFFQNNPFILPAFTRYVREQAASSGARFLVDAYCGSGLFALSAAPAFERVAGVEISATSICFAEQNAAANGIANARFLAGDASAIFAGLDFAPAETAVIIDPPRRGCDEAFLRQLFAFDPRAVVYVSCDPATQMRDLRHFLDAGYTLSAVQPFDLFPQTRHLECVITLRRGNATR
ncbi:SAM-dependent methyltransferase [Cephaloticoccus primus]|uniref:SAM-dependent methyltransferase n=1 Tax=Cephaloticoccus primus TaxID=1548207 RepID=A0A139SHY1_9BACT|nr:SAM-dependent methyltransferase [Cephaloticoccus primus]